MYIYVCIYIHTRATSPPSTPQVVALNPTRNLAAPAAILYEKSLNLITISQGDFGHFKENNLIILSKVAKIALRDCFKFKLFSYKIEAALDHPGPVKVLTPFVRVEG